MMKLSDVIFRYRRWALLGILALGFWGPLDRMQGARPETTWLYLSGMLARYRVLPVAESSVAVMAVAIALALAAAMLRSWATAYLGSGVVQDSALHTDRLVASGPYRYLRNPLYTGLWLHVAALAMLMPPTGALFAVTATALLNAALVRAEERHMLTARGEAYAAYRRSVPRFFPAWTARVADGNAKPDWRNGMLAEIYFWGVAISYVALASRYNATLLVQGVLISFGVGLVVRGLMRPHARWAR